MKANMRTITQSERRQQAFEMRKIGHSYEKIGISLNVSRQAAHGLVMRALVRLTAEIEKDATVLKALELERLDFLTASLWDKAIGGDLGAVDRLLKILERRAKYLGLDAPAKTAASIDFMSDQVHLYLPHKTKPEG